MKFNWDKFLAKTRIVKSDEVTKTKVVKGIVEDDIAPGKSSGIRHAGAGEMLLDEARVYFPDAKIGDELTLPPQWLFTFPVVGKTLAENLMLPAAMGEYGDTIEEATARVVERLEAYVDEWGKG